MLDRMSGRILLPGGFGGAALRDPPQGAAGGAPTLRVRQRIGESRIRWPPFGLDQPIFGRLRTPLFPFRPRHQLTRRMRSGLLFEEMPQHRLDFRGAICEQQQPGQADGRRHFVLVFLERLAKRLLRLVGAFTPQFRNAPV